jgi:hypothetical protein
MYSFTTTNNRYHVTVHGNGWAYEVTHQESGDSLWFQDSDAEQIQAETDNFENEDAIAQYFECLCE